MEEVIKKIANYFGYSAEMVINKNMNHSVSLARNFIFYILHFDYGLSSAVIAKMFGRQPRHIVRQNAITKYRVENFSDYQLHYKNIHELID